MSHVLVSGISVADSLAHAQIANKKLFHSVLIDKQQIIAELNSTMLLCICHASALIYFAMAAQSFNYGVLPHLISSPNLELPIVAD